MRSASGQKSHLKLTTSGGKRLWIPSRVARRCPELRLRPPEEESVTVRITLRSSIKAYQLRARDTQHESAVPFGHVQCSSLSVTRPLAPTIRPKSMRPSGAWLRHSNRSRWTTLRQQSSKSPIQSTPTTKREKVPRPFSVPEKSERSPRTLKSLGATQGNGELDRWPGALHLTPKPLAPRNIRTCNINILEACKAGDAATAWHIYDLMRGRELTPDVYTYSILLHDAKKREDVPAMEQILVTAHEEGLLSQSPFIVADLLHAIYLSEQKKEGGGAPFTTMLSTYQLYFEAQPLKDLGLLPEHYQQSPSSSLMRPPPPPLGMMITAFLAQFEGRLPFESLFNRYCDNVNHGHPIISALAATDHTANAYLMGLGRQLRTLHLCTSVIQYMTRPTKSPATGSRGGDTVQHAAPTVQTWSILIAAFLRHGQRLAAERVLGLMRSRKLEPNLVTWNTLISGHAALQDVDGALSALRGLKEDGFEMDEFSLKGLGRIQERRRLVEALQESDEMEEIEARAASSSVDNGVEQVGLNSDQRRPQKVVFTPLTSLRGG